MWPIEERPVPTSNVPGEATSRTQPFPSWPKPFERQGIVEEVLSDFTLEVKNKVSKYIRNYVVGPLFTPPSTIGTIQLPGIAGGASWAGGAWNPFSGYLYIPSITSPTLVRLEVDTLFEFNKYVRAPPTPVMVDSLYLTKPPYGRITAIDMKTGDHKWMVPMGEGPKDHPMLHGLELPDLGWPFRTHILSTETVLFAAQEGGASKRAFSSRGNSVEVNSIEIDPSLKVLSLSDGHAIAKIPLPLSARGA